MRVHQFLVLLLPIASFLEDNTSIYDPVIKQQIRRYDFQKPAKTLYIKIEAIEIAGNGRSLAIAELDFFGN